MIKLLISFIFLITISSCKTSNENNLNLKKLVEKSKISITEKVKQNEILVDQNKNNNLFYYVGRADSQIKIRGHRVELGEIQNCIKELEEVYDAVILINDQIKFQEKIYAFIIQTKVDLTKKKIINYLEKKLPNYMMPSEIYFIKNNFPRNENGKIDKKALLNLIDKQ